MDLTLLLVLQDPNMNDQPLTNYVLYSSNLITFGQLEYMGRFPKPTTTTIPSSLFHVMGDRQQGKRTRRH